MDKTLGEYHFTRLETVVFGVGKVEALGRELSRRGSKRALIVTGKTLGHSKLLDKVKSAAGSALAGDPIFGKSPFAPPRSGFHRSRRVPAVGRIFTRTPAKPPPGRKRLRSRNSTAPRPRIRSRTSALLLPAAEPWVSPVSRLPISWFVFLRPPPGRSTEKRDTALLSPLPSTWTWSPNSLPSPLRPCPPATPCN